MKDMWKPLAISLWLAGTGAWACPSPPDHSAALDALLTQVQAAESETEGRLITNRMWELWATAPDDAAQAVLDSGLRKRASYDFLGALAEFDKLVDYCPDYAEGYNQRAFVNFIRQDYAVALEDLDRALDLSPRHVAAMAGKALTLMGLGRMYEGQQVLKQALALNPWLPERRMVLPPPGKDL
ncbi:tetratricopeptide repeat protein [Thalassovita sp.]|uniref:tetratricopeptide repeat protein n=1 Tax=Thalassovita sp. TaxID=1979401 RepID=UPI0039B6EC57